MMRRLLLILLFAVLTFGALPARADDNRPLTVAIVAEEAGHFQIGRAHV